MEAVIGHYQTEAVAAPALVVFLTDGGPSSRSEAERTLCSAARLPIFWQFVGFDNGRARKNPFGVLERFDVLDVPRKRVIDNAGLFKAGADPHALSDDALIDNLLIEFPVWLKKAKKQKIVRVPKKRK